MWGICFNRRGNYKSILYAGIKSGEEYLKTTQTGKCSDQQNPVTKDETKEVAQILKLKKSKGPDGFSTIYCKTFQEILIKPLTWVMNEIQQGQVLFSLWQRDFHFFDLQRG